ncbi:MAG: flagellar protein FlaG [Nitrosomonas sp.]
MNINQLNGTNNYSLPLPVTSEKVAANPVQVPPPSPVNNIQPETNSESNQHIQKAVEKIQDAVTNLARNLRFSIDEDSGRTIIKVMDAHTDEVIRQIPTKEAMEIAHTLDRVQGLLFNDKA